MIKVKTINPHLEINLMQNQSQRTCPEDKNVKRKNKRKNRTKIKRRRTKKKRKRRKKKVKSRYRQFNQQAAQMNNIPVTKVSLK